MTVRTATRPGDHTSEDRLYTLPQAVIILDGASGPGPDQRDGAWYADSLGANLRRLLVARPNADLTGTLEAAIDNVAREHQLTPGHSPSAAVAIARWRANYADCLTLGDSPIIAFLRDGRTQTLTDTRLAVVGRYLREHHRGRLLNRSGYDAEHRRILGDLRRTEREHRNREGGYWIAEADPTAAHHTHLRSWPLDDLIALVLATDGVARGIHLYGTPHTWNALLRAGTTVGPASVVANIHGAEDSDPSGHRWPRSKAHDDKTLAIVSTKPTLDGCRDR